MGLILNPYIFGSIPAPTLLPDMAGAAAYPSSSNQITGNWTLPDTTTWTLETTTVRSGTTSFKVDDGTAGTSAFRSNSFLPAGYTSGKTYRLTGYYYIVSGTDNRIRQYDPTTVFSQEFLSTSTGSWIAFTLDHVAGQNTGYRLYFGGNGTFYVDDLELVELP